MRVIVVCSPEEEAGSVRLEDPETFDDLRVVVSGEDPGCDRLAAILAPYGDLDADGAHLFLEPEALPHLAGPLADDPGWRGRYDGMVGFAAAKGWTDDRGRLRAHVEASPT